MNTIRIKTGNLILAVVIIVIFQNCNKSAFTPIASTSGDITDPVILNSKKCEYDGKEYYHSQTIETFRESSVAYDKQCEKQSHTCNNGEWTGTIGYKDCGVGVPKDCKIGNETIKHLEISTRFLAASVPFDQNCRSEDRKCIDGEINGNYLEKSCVRQSPPAPSGKFECVRRRGNDEPPAIIPASGLSGTVNIRADIYEKWTDGTYHFVQKCLEWQATKENAALNCGAEISGTSGNSVGSVIRNPICCPQGRVSINGLCETENGVGEYCYADSQCRAGLYCASHLDTATGNWIKSCKQK